MQQSTFGDPPATAAPPPPQAPPQAQASSFGDAPVQASAPPPSPTGPHGFVQSFVQSQPIHPMNAIKDLESPSGKFNQAFNGNGTPPLNPFTDPNVAALPSYGDLATPFAQAMGQGQAGDYTGAAGTLAGGVGVPLVAGKVLSAVPGAAGSAAEAASKAPKAAAKIVRAGVKTFVPGGRTAIKAYDFFNNLQDEINPPPKPAAKTKATSKPLTPPPAATELKPPPPAAAAPETPPAPAPITPTQAPAPWSDQELSTLKTEGQPKFNDRLKATMPEAPAAQAGPDPKLLNDISLGQIKKPYNKLNAGEKSIVDNLASKISGAMQEVDERPLDQQPSLPPPPGKEGESGVPVSGHKTKVKVHNWVEDKKANIAAYLDHKGISPDAADAMSVDEMNKHLPDVYAHAKSKGANVPKNKYADFVPDNVDSWKQAVELLRARKSGSLPAPPK